MKVWINDLTKDTAEEIRYLATCEKDCKDDLDLRVYRLVLEFDDVITMGKVIGEPFRD